MTFLFGTPDSASMASSRLMGGVQSLWWVTFALRKSEQPFVPEEITQLRKLGPQCSLFWRKYFIFYVNTLRLPKQTYITKNYPLSQAFSVSALLTFGAR